MVLRRGSRRRTPALEVYMFKPCRPAEGAKTAELPRVGWIVPKLGHGIVERNRVKRRRREIARRRILVRLRDGRCGGDILVRARRAAYRATYQELEAEWTSVVEAACSHR